MLFYSYVSSPDIITSRDDTWRDLGNDDLFKMI